MIKLVAVCDRCGREILQQSVSNCYTICFSLTELKDSGCSIIFANGKYLMFCEKCSKKGMENDNSTGLSEGSCQFSE